MSSHTYTDLEKEAEDFAINIQFLMSQEDWFTIVRTVGAHHSPISHIKNKQRCLREMLESSADYGLIGRDTEKYRNFSTHLNELDSIVSRL
jgi:hypothetical protein